MAGRHIEKYPIVWSGDMAFRDLQIQLKASYLWGSIVTALVGLPKETIVPVKVLTKNADISFETLAQNKDICVLTCIPGDSDRESRPHEEKIFAQACKELLASGACGFEMMDLVQCRVHVYIKTKKLSSLLAQLSPDVFHMYCERNYMLMVVFK